ncbi:MAG: carbamoyltransferase HypF [Actinobacteria bacterium]|nr:carbamoyltransferase HypF [Actinomycetota bacterium]
MAATDPAPRQRDRLHLRIEGIVQGVGFRPFVFRLATELGLGGRVWNDAQGVLVDVEGEADLLPVFLRRLRSEAPALSRIEGVETSSLPPRGTRTFEIAASATGGAATVPVSPDVATCDACAREVADPSDRRFRYPFTNCTDCGPRYSIVVDVPYDRPNTTMSGFPLCADCDREYHDPHDRRFHAQPLCCPACGPRLRLLGPTPDRSTDGVDDPVADAALAAAAERLLAGEIVAVKGLGGYHLAVLASSEQAAARLRSRKHREDKPFAVMVRDLDAAAHLCHVGPLDAALLTDRARPIVLLPRRGAAPIAPSVAPGNRSLGLLLPYTPLHDLLLEAVGTPLVLTSGNVSDEPIAFRDADARDRLAGIADAFLVHDRPIAYRTDDSVVRPMGGRPVMLRRSRGYAPAPLPLPVATDRHVLAVGAELKSTVCLARGRHAFVSPHIGDLENYETFRSFLATVSHLQRVFDVRPTVVAHDLHPEYLSTKHAVDLEGVELLGVQHHHAHIASCLADNDETGPVLGVAFDGTGFGTDGTVWGGEVLVADLAGFERVAALTPVPMPGGTAAIREPWRMAAIHLRAAFGEVPDQLEVRRRNVERWTSVLAVADAGVNSPQTSSAGRLFDAVAAIVGTRDAVTYEGQAAIELEQLADPDELGAYRFGPAPDAAGLLRLRCADLVRAVAEDVLDGTAPATVAARFHNGVVAGVASVCRRLADERGLTTVALSGGVFQNVLLTERLVAALAREGLRVFTHRRVPPNDGGISFGQAAVAAAVSSRSTW